MYPWRDPPVREAEYYEGQRVWLESARPVAIPGTPATQLIESGRLVLYGWSLVNSSTAAVTVSIRDGQDATGLVVAPVVVPASGNAVEFLGDPGIGLDIGCFLTGLAGVITGTLYLKPASVVGYGGHKHG